MPKQRIDWRDLPPIPAKERAAVTIPEAPSQTFLGWHDVCERAAFLYAKYGGGAGSHAMNRGSLFHEAAANLTTLVVEQGEYSIPPELAKDELLRVLKAHPELTVSAYERDQLRAMIHNWAMGSFFRPESVIGVEQDLTLEVGNFTIRCRVDLIEQPATWMLDITDYKTQWNMPRSGQEEEWAPGSLDEQGNPRYGGNFQTQVYALAAAFGVTPAGVNLGAGIDRFRVFLRFPRHLREEGLAYSEATITRQQLTDFRFDLESQLERLERAIETGKWQPTPGNHCQRCPAEGDCPLPRVLRPESQLASLDDPAELEKLAANWYFMSERAKKLKGRIRAAAEQLDLEMVYIGDDLALRWIFNERESLKPKALPKIRTGIEGATKYGHDFDLSDFVTYSQSTAFDKRKVPPRRHTTEKEQQSNANGNG